MKRRQTLMGVFAGLGMLILILDGKTALDGAREGLALAVQSVIPSLFPFFFLSNLLTAAWIGSCPFLLRPLAELFSLPRGAQALLIPMLLGGYPAGAQCIGEWVRTGSLSRRDGERLLSFCSNAGPSFLFGIIAPMFPKLWMGWSLWLIHILGALTVSRFFAPQGDITLSPVRAGPDPSAALSRAVTVTALVCGWVVQFRVVIAFCRRWFLWLFPAAVRTALCGLLELTNGIVMLSTVADIRLRLLLCSVILSLGGLCVSMQTASVTNGLRLKYYLTGKAIQALVSAALCVGIFYQQWWLIAVWSFVLIIPGKKQKRSSIQPVLGV